MSGVFTKFPNLDETFRKSLQKRVDERLNKYTEETFKPNFININVTNSNIQDLVWFGGSNFSSQLDFDNIVHKREEYFEKGPSCCRFNPMSRSFLI